MAAAQARSWVVERARPALIGLGVAALYVDPSPAGRQVVTVLAPAPILFLGLFLSHFDAARLTLSGTDKAIAAEGRPSAPAVVIVFDELPTNSLLDAHRRIDPVRFPHFAALARGSAWFANESVVSEGTLQGVPALLTGRFPRPDELPLYHDHPENLFTLLGRNANLHVVETETHLCPPKLCHDSHGSLGSDLGSLYEDAGIVYLHQLLPDDLAHSIPSISNGWQDFWRNGGARSDPSGASNGFSQPSGRAEDRRSGTSTCCSRTAPGASSPSGRRYEIRPAPGWSSAEVWTDNQAAVDQYWQRHLLQLGFADRVLGELVARLKAAGLYDRSLVVVTADEGSFSAPARSGGLLGCQPSGHRLRSAVRQTPLSTPRTRHPQAHPVRGRASDDRRCARTPAPVARRRPEPALTAIPRSPTLPSPRITASALSSSFGQPPSSIDLRAGPAAAGEALWLRCSRLPICTG